MKLLKRVLAGTLALALVLGLGAPAALAEEAGPSETAAPAEEEKRVIGTVTGFGELAVTEISMAERLPIGDILARLPDTLGVYLDGSTELTQIPVSWYCPGGYEDSNDFYFQFSPTWDEDSYPLMRGIDVELDAPYVSVYLADLSALGTLPAPEEESGEDAVRRAVAPGSADEIFAVLTSELGLNSAAACGVLANMHAESALNPRSICKDINGKTSYGLCQWNGPRYERLKSWCKANNENYTTVTGQLHFLKYELTEVYTKVYNHVLDVEDTEEGAYDAAYYWCYYFEMPASRGKRSKERGNLARNTYWPNYGGTALDLDQMPTPVLTGVTTPEITLPQGKPFHLAGTIQCSKPLEEVAVWVLDSRGAQVTGVTVNPNVRIFSLSGVDSQVKFSKLANGDYTYSIKASVEGESYDLLAHEFSVAGGKDSAPADQGEEELPPADEPADSEDGDTAEAQDPDAPTLTGVSLPAQEHPQGMAITVRGTVEARETLDEVAARVLRTDGSEATGGSAEPGSKRYNLNRLDRKVGFSKLESGSYTYVITARSGEQTWTLLEFPFVIVSRAPAHVRLTRKVKALRVRWAETAGAEGYEVQYADNADFQDADIVTVTAPTKKLKHLAKKQRYYVRVRSFVLQADGERSYSAFSRAKSAKTK